VPSNDINDVLTGANVLGDVTVRFSKESGGLIKSKDLCQLGNNKNCFFLIKVKFSVFHFGCYKKTGFSFFKIFTFTSFLVFFCLVQFS